MTLLRWHWVAIALLGCSSLLAETGFYTEAVTSGGVSWCCSKRYVDCDAACRAGCLGNADCQPKPDCLKDCRDKHCRRSTGYCDGDTGPKGPPPPVENSITPTPGFTPNAEMSLRYDGQVTGPGTVNFEISRRGPTGVTLTVYGILYGHRADNGKIEILQKTGTHDVVASEPSRFHFEVSQENYDDWSTRYIQLTVGIALASEADRSRWTYRNELTDKDATTARKGQMQVKGEFLWNQGD